MTHSSRELEVSWGKWAPLSAEKFDEVINTISFPEACSRVGRFYDLWLEDPAMACALFEDMPSRTNDLHPLRALFTPPVHTNQVCSSPTLRRTTDLLHLNKDSAFNVGDHVKARLSDDMKLLDDGHEPHQDRTREWYDATIEMIHEDGSCSIAWEHGYHGDRVKRLEDVIPAAVTGSDVAGVRYILARSTRTFGFIHILVYCSVLALILMMPEVAFYLHSDGYILCATPKDEVTSVVCTLAREIGMTRHPRRGFGLIMSVGLILTCAAGYSFVLPFFYRALHLWKPDFAKILRQRIITVIIDPVRTQLLPNLHGVVENHVLVMAASASACCVGTAAILYSAGLVPLGFLMIKLAMRCVNAVLGERTGVSEIRFKQVLNYLEKHLEQSSIDMTTAELHDELQTFLTARSDSGVMCLSLGFITLLASALNIDNADSVRMDTILVPKAYARFTHPPQKLASSKGRHDIVVDVFRESCTVPGISTVGDRWFKEGAKIPWHLAIHPMPLKQFEKELTDLGMVSGDGCFTWRSPRNGMWHTRDAENTHAKIAFGEELVSRQQHLDFTLNDLIMSDEVDEKKALAFLRAGADPNFEFDPGNVGSSTINRALKEGKMEIAKLLIEHRADITKKDAQGKTSFDLIKDRSVRMELSRFVFQLEQSKSDSKTILTDLENYV